MSYLNFLGAATGPPPVLVNHGGLTENTTASINVNYPAGLAAGDILILHTARDDPSNPGPTITVPGDWALINDTLYYSAGYRRLAAYWKRAIGSEVGSISISTTLSGSSDSFSGIISAWRGCVTTGAPVEAVAFNWAASGGPAASPGCTTLGPNRTVLKLYHLSGDLSNTPGPVSPAGGFTEIYDLNGTLGTMDPRLVCGSLEKPAAGAVASDNTTLTQTGTWGVMQFALIPA